jgi:hypothetical protein
LLSRRLFGIKTRGVAVLWRAVLWRFICPASKASPSSQKQKLVTDNFSGTLASSSRSLVTKTQPYQPNA